MAATREPGQGPGSATIDDLYRVPDHGKAELVDGELVLMSPTGFLPGRASAKICRSLEDYEPRTGSGYAIPDNVGFVVDLPRRRSFSPAQPLSMSVRRRVASSWKERRSSPWKCRARKTTAQPPSE